MEKPAGGANTQWLAKEYGGLIGSGETAVATALASAEVLGADADRIVVVFVNTGANVVLLATQQNNLPGNGIVLAANGGRIEMNIRQHASLVQERWCAASLVGASSILIASRGSIPAAC